MTTVWRQIPAALVISLAIGTLAGAEDAGRPPSASPALASPRDTMASFLEAMSRLFEHPEEWSAATRCLALEEVPRDVHRQRARQLYAVLNRIERVDVADLPGAEQVADQQLRSYRYFPDPARHGALLTRIGAAAGDIDLSLSADGAWRFSAETVQRLPRLHAQLENQPLVAGRETLTLSDWLEARIPSGLVQGELLNVKYWQWFALFLVILGGLLLDLVVQLALRVFTRRVMHRLDSEEDQGQLRKTLRPLGLAVAAGFWLVALRFVGLEGAAAGVLEAALSVFLVLVATLSAWRLIDLAAAVLMARAQRTSTKFDDVLIPLVTKTIKIFVVAMGVIYGADALDIPITPLLASLTVAGVGFSFAAKDTVENFFGSVAVLLDRPFDIGDWIVVGETEGIVEEVGFRSTRVRTFYNSQITIPNSNLVRAVVDNYGRRRFRRWRTTLGVQYDTPPERLVAFAEGIRELIRNHPYTRKDYYQVWCNEFGASSLDILLYMFFEVPDWNTELRERERLFLDIVRLADRLGVQFAFPTQTVHVFPGQAPGEAAGPPGVTSERDAGYRGIREAQRLIHDQPWRHERPGPVVFSTGPTDVQLDDAGNPLEAEEDEAPPVS